jgi:hypothetical protein
MTLKDTILLEKAYLSISKPVPSVPSDDIEDPNAAPLDDTIMSPEPAPMSPEDGGLGLEAPSVGPEMGMEGDGIHNPQAELDIQDEAEEDSMAVDNLNSVRESAMKIATYWSSGGHLEPWQQQKLAIAMSMLADIARALR